MPIPKTTRKYAMMTRLSNIGQVALGKSHWGSSQLYRSGGGGSKGNPRAGRTGCDATGQGLAMGRFPRRFRLRWVGCPPFRSGDRRFGAVLKREKLAGPGRDRVL